MFRTSQLLPLLVGKNLNNGNKPLNGPGRDELLRLEFEYGTANIFLKFQNWPLNENFSLWCVEESFSVLQNRSEVPSIKELRFFVHFAKQVQHVSDVHLTKMASHLIQKISAFVNVCS